jgi:hypothetical protein
VLFPCVALDTVLPSLGPSFGAVYGHGSLGQSSPQLFCFFPQDCPCYSSHAYRALPIARSSVDPSTTWTGLAAAQPV